MEELTPKQQEFLANYTNPNSETFGNALQSALKAGYSQEYSENITSLMPDWLSENIGMNKRLKQAEKVLDRTLEMPAVDQEGKVDNQLLKTQVDVAKFFASTVGKKTYSPRTETDITSGGKPIPILNAIFTDNSDKEDSETEEEN
jgi:hypothetical protein